MEKIMEQLLAVVKDLSDMISTYSMAIFHGFVKLPGGIQRAHRMMIVTKQQC